MLLASECAFWDGYLKIPWAGCPCRIPLGFRFQSPSFQARRFRWNGDHLQNLLRHLRDWDRWAVKPILVFLTMGTSGSYHVTLNCFPTMNDIVLCFYYFYSDDSSWLRYDALNNSLLTIVSSLSSICWHDMMNGQCLLTVSTKYKITHQG